MPWLGERLRAERVRQGMSLRALARVVGVSASMISQIETAKAQPSVSTLYAITSALGISVEGLFVAPPQPAAAAGGTEPPASPAVTASPASPASPAVTDGSCVPAGAATAGAATAVEALGSMRGTRLGPLVRPAERPTLSLQTGVTWQLLGELPGRAVDFLLITYPPGGSSSGTGGLMRHSGGEYGFVMSGELVLTLGFEEVRLRAGDSISFESSTPHSYRNEGTGPAVGVWFVLEHDR